MTPQQKLIEWAEKQKPWQQDALRKAAQSTVISEQRNQEIISLLKKEHGILIEGVEQLECIPLDSSHIKPRSDDSPKTLLCSLGNVKNVDRLAEDQLLRFALDGITLIYGENGSGKSGYCRITKALCRSKDTEPLKGNIYDPAEKKPATVEIKYQIGDQPPRPITWEEGSPSPQQIAHISVFDSKNARLYVDKKNRIEYLPLEIEILTQYAQILGWIDQTLESEKETLKKHIVSHPLPTFQSNTAVANLMKQLDVKIAKQPLPSVDQIRLLAVWNEEMETSLKQTQEAVDSDPKTLATKYRRIQKIISDLAQKVSDIEIALSLDGIKISKKLYDNVQEKVEAAKIAASEEFLDSPLKQIGSNPWKQMFAYAKEYSKLVYPEVVPPATRDGDKCVLCQQDLTPEAANRIRHFEAFISNHAASEAELALQAIKTLELKLQKLKIYTKDEIEKLLGEFESVGETQKDLAKSISDFIAKAGDVRNALIAALTSGNFDDFQALPQLSCQLSKAAIDLNERADSYDKLAADEAARQKLRDKLTELSDQKKLSENIETVLSRQSEVDSFLKLVSCQKEAKNTASLSRLVSELREDLITKDFEKKLRKEISQLNLTHIPFKLEESSTKGQSYVGVALDARTSVSCSDILSEGEQRALALACFLADVTSQPSNQGIIIDDPVSSLDHKRIKIVAKRLVEEASKGRQVIIFTHNLPFFHEIRNAAAAKNPDVKIASHYMQNRQESFGLVNEKSLPWIAMKVKDRIKALQERLDQFPPEHDAECYRQAVRDFYGDLRDSWERLVEEILFSGVVERYSSAVHTKQLRSVSVSDDDYKKIYWAMTSVSEHCHDYPIHSLVPLPTLDDMRKALEEFKEYIKLLKKRADSTSNARKEAESPKEADLVEP